MTKGEKGGEHGERERERMSNSCNDDWRRLNLDENASRRWIEKSVENEFFTNHERNADFERGRKTEVGRSPRIKERKKEITKRCHFKVGENLIFQD